MLEEFIVNAPVAQSTRNVKLAIERGESSPRLAASGPLEIGFGPRDVRSSTGDQGSGWGRCQMRQMLQITSLLLAEVTEYMN
jgi:hypothetical protein